MDKIDRGPPGFDLREGLLVRYAAPTGYYGSELHIRPAQVLRNIGGTVHRILTAGRFRWRARASNFTLPVHGHFVDPFQASHCWAILTDFFPSAARRRQSAPAKERSRGTTKPIVRRAREERGQRAAGRRERASTLALEGLPFLRRSLSQRWGTCLCWRSAVALKPLRSLFKVPYGKTTTVPPPL